MVLPASQIQTITTNAINNNSSQDLQTEVSLAEERIRSSAALGLSNVVYNATIIGNPQVDPNLNTELPINQLSFFNLFVQSGYLVGLDTATGYWSISWEESGPELNVQVYSLRTTVFNPASVVVPTVTAIQTYFNGVRPIIHSTISYNGFIDEVAFGATSSQYFEFTIVVDQKDQIDHSANLKAFLIAQGLGYFAPNCNFYKISA